MSELRGYRPESEWLRRSHMIKDTWEQIKQGLDVRQNLSNLRKEIKEDGGTAMLQGCLTDCREQLILLLQHEDAKTRKNAALLMGDLGEQAYLEPLYDAYAGEQQMFVKSSYLAAMKNLDYRQYLPELKVHLEELTKSEAAPENEKHVREEVRELSTMIVLLEGVRMHEFYGKDKAYEVVLLTNRNFQAVTQERLKECHPGVVTKVFNAGVMAAVKNLDWTEQVRTYQELLLRINKMKSCPMDPFEAAKVIADSDLLEFMKRNHTGTAPFYFRIEFKSKMELSRKSDFTKKLSGQLEKLTERQLINTTSNYELEIRLVENKEGNCNVLVKLFTLKDHRFAYRQDVVSVSIRPVNAALTVALAKGFLTENGAVLDPFCGVGTMLIERHKLVKANTTYGIDVLEDSILKARANTERARQIIHYVNRDFFDFTHEYLFDEIITNMPFKQGYTTGEDIEKLYQSFFPAARERLKDNGIVVLYSHNREQVKRLAPGGGFTILKEFEISMREGTYVFVLRKNMAV